MICHAAGETGPATTGTHAVILAIPNEQSLLQLAERLSLKGLDFHLIHEPDAPWNGQAMALGLRPGPRCKALGGLPLYGKNTKGTES